MQDDITNDIRNTQSTIHEYQNHDQTTPHADSTKQDPSSGGGRELSNLHAVAIIEYNLHQVVSKNGLQYYKSREIADLTGLTTKLVATLIHTVDDVSDHISIEKWAYTSATTWRVETTE